MSTATLDRKACSRCGKVKPIGAFYVKRGRRTAACRPCTRIHKAAEARTPEAKATLAAWRARPEVRERERARKAINDRSPATYDRRRRQRRTVLGRLKGARDQARCLLRRATDPKAIARLEVLIALHTREIDRITRAADLGETDRT